MGEIFPSCIACEMLLAMLSNLPWASSIMESCFSLAAIEALRYFRAVGVIREKSRLVLPKAIPTGSPTPLASPAIDIPSVSTVDVIRLVSQYHNGSFHFFSLLFIFFNFIKKECLSFTQFVPAICLCFLWCCRVLIWINFGFIVV